MDRLVTLAKIAITTFGSRLLRPFYKNLFLNYPTLIGDKTRLRAHPTVTIGGTTLVNLNSGDVRIGAHTFFGYGVSLITGTHDYHLLGPERVIGIPRQGRDIVIGEGVWICSNTTILGPCKIGDNSVVAAGAVVTAGTEIPPGEIWGGVPARFIKRIEG